VRDVDLGLSPTRSSLSAGQLLVLLVDDDASVLRALGRTLRRRGYDVATASSVAGAREHLDSLDVDIVLADFALRDGNGLDVVDAARGRDPDLPVLLIAGNPVMIPTSPLRAPVRCLTKPIDEADLLDALASVRRRERATISDLAGRLDSALGGLYLAFQPIVRWSEQRAIAHEVLVRSRDPMLGRPERLIAAATMRGRVDEIGRDVRRRVAAHLDQVGGRDGDLFVNLHPIELADPDLSDPEAPLARHARRIVFDISERATLDRNDAAQRLAVLRELGYRIALDDIGDSGGLALLAVLRPEVLKIDSVLIRGVRADAVRRATVQGLFDLGARLGAMTIAEGVETEDDLAGVIGAGGDLMTGFVFGRPGAEPPAVELATLKKRTGL
jgi:EAL domain-containing protein (putative c-di-GMP-specific phosphodiesterase class I)